MGSNKNNGGGSSATDLAVKAGGGALAPVHDYGQMAGQGFDRQTNEDVSTPFLGVLQPMSPEVNKKDAAYIQGAEPGMLFNTVTGDLYSGETGLIFQPVDTNHCYVEWRPRTQGGGFVAQHPLDSPMVAKAKADSKEFGKYKTPEGNDLIETFYVIGCILPEGLEQLDVGHPMMIAFTSTKIKVYKALMLKLRTLAGRPPLFANRVKITTVEEKNAKGVFYNFKVMPAAATTGLSLIPPSIGEGESAQAHPLLLAGQQLVSFFRAGSVKVNYEKQSGAGSGSGAEESTPF